METIADAAFQACNDKIGPEVAKAAPPEIMMDGGQPKWQYYQQRKILTQHADQQLVQELRRVSRFANRYGKKDRKMLMNKIDKQVSLKSGYGATRQLRNANRIKKRLRETDAQHHRIKIANLLSRSTTTKKKKNVGSHRLRILKKLRPKEMRASTQAAYSSCFLEAPPSASIEWRDFSEVPEETRTNLATMPIQYQSHDHTPVSTDYLLATTPILDNHTSPIHWTSDFYVVCYYCHRCLRVSDIDTILCSPYGHAFATNKCRI